jgi:hypothetical protein
LDLLKELYFFEWARREQVVGSANVPIAIQTALAAGTFYLLRTFHYDSDECQLAFVALVALSVIAQARAVCFIARAMHGYWYKQIADSDEIRSYWNGLQEYYRAAPDADGSMDADFDTYLEQTFSEATDRNRQNNARMGDAVHQATASLIAALVLLASASAPYMVNALSFTPTPARVQLVGQCNTSAEGERAMSGKESKPAPPPPPPPAKPTPPPTQEVRKGGGKK